MEGLAYMDSVKDTRTGVNSNFTGLDQSALGSTQSGVAINQLSTMAAQRVEQIARHFSSGIAECFAILHEIILKSGHKADVVKLRGQWVTVNPAEWRRRTDFKISVGYAAGNKDAMVQRLMMIANQQLQAMQLGLPVVQPRNVYETNIELAKAADVTTPERFFTDPADVPPPGPPQPDPTVMAAEQLKTQSAERIKAADIASAEKIKEGELQLQKYQTDRDNEVKLRIAAHNADHAMRVEAHKGQVQAGLKQIEGQQTLSLKEREMQMKNAPAQEVSQYAKQIEQLAGAMQSAVETMQGTLQTILTAKRTIRRGKDGKAEGVDIVGEDGSVLAQQSIKRGADGRIAGSA
jgi:hypothetical protein